MAETITFTNNELFVLTSGSPETTFVFKQIARSVALDNVGSGNIYFTFDNNIDVGSTTPMLLAGDFRSFPLSIGSIKIMRSGTDSSTIQIYGAY